MTVKSVHLGWKQDWKQERVTGRREFFRPAVDSGYLRKERVNEEKKKSVCRIGLPLPVCSRYPDK